MGVPISRRGFVQWAAAAGVATSLPGLVSCPDQAGAAEDTTQQEGVWLNAPCYNNCSCGASRCLNKVYVVDGIPMKTRSDEEEGDTYATPQRRACLRGRAKMSEVLSPARIKYPMRRRHFSLDDPHGELRGIDEWERISWDEALDLVAAGIKQTIDRYGIKGILCGASPNIGDGYYDQNVNLLNALGGAVHCTAGTVSFGALSVVDTHMLGGLGYAGTPHHLLSLQSELHVLFGCNWASNKAGNHTWYVQEWRRRGAKVIIIDPWLNQTAQVVADEWIPILPGTDNALMIAICHEWIQNGTYDQEYLDKYTIGFDEESLPEHARGNHASWKDYVMGLGYDMIEKTPEWAQDICGVPADTIRALAAEIAAADKVNFFMGQSVTKIPAGEQVTQAFYTMALMHGGIGTPGHYMSWTGQADFTSGTVAPGAYCPVTADPVNPLAPAGSPIYMWYPIPLFDVLGDADWLNLEISECWRTIEAGEYGRDCWPGGKIPIDIHAAYFGGHMSTLNQIPDTNRGIDVVRGFDFVWGVNPFFDSTRQYCDVLLPCSTFWEKPGKAFAGDSASCLWFDQIMPPLYESRYESEIAEALATRLGLDPKVVNTLSDAERTYATVRDATYTTDAFQTTPLLSITQDEIDTYFPGVEGAPQEGEFTFKEFRDRGILKYPLTEESFALEPYSMFYMDPEANPLKTASGKFEIYCEPLAYVINAVGYSHIEPIGVWQVGDAEQGVTARTDEYPLLLWTPHSLRRAHSVNDNVVSLREAFPQECFMSTVDAEERGLKNGDIVLMSSPYGKVLRPVKIMPAIVPGAVAIQDGSWFQIDPETGIDLGGCPNILQAPKSSGEGTQCWTGTIVQVQKYEGPLTLLPDKDRPIVTPVGIE